MYSSRHCELLTAAGTTVKKSLRPNSNGGVYPNFCPVLMIADESLHAPISLLTDYLARSISCWRPANLHEKIRHKSKKHLDVA